MIWSVSTGKMFERCQRQWFFKTQLANARAKDETRQMAYRLSKLQSLSAWRGNLVDQVLSRDILPAIEQGRPMNIDQAVAQAMQRFDRQLRIGRAHRLHDPDFKPSALGDNFVAFHVLQYGGQLRDDDIAQARDEVRRAISAFFSMRELLDLLHAADRLVTQRALVFGHSDVSVRAVPDVIVFSGDKAPTIIDWKVHAFGRNDAWLQLAVYAAALTRCKPHKDFPFATNQFQETDIALWEVQLLTGVIRRHLLTEEQLRRADEHIAQSAERMILAMDGRNGKAADLPPTDFPATKYASVCGRCPYKALCWEVIQ